MSNQTWAAPPELPASADDLREHLRKGLRIPVATYRLQLQPAFGFRDATAIVPYLAALGVTDCYCSPYLKARPGSTHGYDICDYGTLNPELGSEADFQAFVEELAAHGMGHLLDFVPNHMAVEPVLNRWWRDMLEHGPASPCARFFDVDWDPIKPELRGKILLPFLGDHYGRVLERGELQVAFVDGALVLRHGNQDRPIDPGQYPRVLRIHLDDLQATLGGQAVSVFHEFLGILTMLDHLPAATVTEPERIEERLHEARLAQQRLARLAAASAPIRQHIEDAIRVINGQPGHPESFDALHELLEAQSYRLACWKTAVHEINFRRFFDVNELAGLRMEDPDVFAAAHSLVLRLIREGQLTGLRLDHVDGLFDPSAYLDKLQTAVAWRDAGRGKEPAGPLQQPLYIVAEKILSGSETLPGAWPIHGTTGYDFLNDLNRLFVEARNSRAMKRVYERFAGRVDSFADIVYESKEMITWTALASELNVLAHALNRISEGDRRTRDFTLDSLREALREVVACFPVYRTYVNADGAADTDRQVIDLAIHRARRRNPAMETTAFDFVREVLLPDRQKLPEAEYQSRLRLAMRFQQYTGPLQAKGVEDTAFYRYNVLVSLNEVGGDPQRFGGTPTQFHEANRRRLEQCPFSMLATTTHDTKRGEDARARLNALSEMPDEWRRRVSRWKRINSRQRTIVDGEPAPDRNDEYLFYQTLIGCWPAEPVSAVPESAPAALVQRLREYLLKATKEAKVHTSWITPNEAYDQAVAAFVEKTLVGSRARRFLADFLPFQQRIARLGMINSLAQVVLKIASPGVPDFYQGAELWDLSLVDPDNRRPVDFAPRSRMLKEMEVLFAQPASNGAPHTLAVTSMLDQWQDGRIKLYLTACGLHLRQRHRRVFLEGEYLPLEVEGECAENIVAVARRHGEQCVLAVVPRLAAHLAAEDRPVPIGSAVWKATCIRLPTGCTAPFRNVFTREVAHCQGSALRLAEVLRVCPVAFLEVEQSSVS
jgi:(1->4)-alpha-D-glucan 1-alpha-D-glucosylmutase